MKPKTATKKRPRVRKGRRVARTAADLAFAALSDTAAVPEYGHRPILRPEQVTEDGLLMRLAQRGVWATGAVAVKAAGAVGEVVVMIVARLTLKVIKRLSEDAFRAVSIPPPPGEKKFRQ